ncbi:hypothetical protein MBLNU457_6189t1 [Dothideomycetes sp. NU457]
MDLPKPRTLREKEGYLGLDFHGLPNKEARDFVKNKVIRMNKKFCHLDSQQIKSSATVLHDRQMFIDIMRKKISHFITNYPNLAERARKAKRRTPASRAVSETPSDSDDDEITNDKGQASFRATDTACKLDVDDDDDDDAQNDTPYTLELKFTIASEKLATIKDSIVTQQPSSLSPMSSSFPPRPVLLLDFLPHATPSPSEETVNTSAVHFVAYEPAFEPAFAPSDTPVAATASHSTHQIPTPDVEALSVKFEPGEELYPVLPRLKPDKKAITRADPGEVFVEIWIASDNSNHSIHFLDSCLTMPDLFTKVASELEIYSIERLSVGFKDDNVVRFWKHDLKKDGSPVWWKKTVDLACERQTDVVDGTIVVTVDPRDVTPLVAIDD